MQLVFSSDGIFTFAIFKFLSGKLKAHTHFTLLEAAELAVAPSEKARTEAI